VTDDNCGLDQEAVAAFPWVSWKEVKGVTGRVDMLWGFDNLKIFPHGGGP
jgi:hypothetical protein